MAAGRSASTEDELSIRTAIIGAGLMGADHAKIVAEDLPGAVLQVVCDMDADRAKSVADAHGAVDAASDPEAVIARGDVDAVIIATPHHWHAPITIAAMQAGKDTYIEKPISHVHDEGPLIIAAAKRYGRVVQQGSQMRSSPVSAKARKLLDDGIIGKVLEIRGRGKEDRRGGGEDLRVLGSHVMNLIHYLGGEPEWCFAQALTEHNPVTKRDVKPGSEGIGPLAGDQIRAMYGLPDGITAHFDSHRNAAGGRFGIQIFGSKGIIEILTGYLPAVHVLQDPAWSPGRSKKNWTPVSSIGIGKPEPLGANGLHAGNIAACKDLIAAIEEDRLPECNYYEARTTVEMISGIFESHRRGQPTKFPLSNRKNPLELLSAEN